MTTETLTPTEGMTTAPDSPTISAPVAAVSPAPVTEEVDWKKRFTGLQGTYQREQEKWKADTARIKELEGLLAGLDTERNSLQAKVDELAPLPEKYAVLQAQHERFSIIAGEFPALITDERDGLLPTGSGDELRAKLTKIVERRQASVQDAGKAAAGKLLEGAVPPTPSGVQPQGSEQLYKAALAALREGKTAEYKDLYDQYIKALQEEDK